MKSYSKLWRLLFAIAIIAIAIQQIAVDDLMPVIVPPTPVWIADSMPCIVIGSLLLLAAGLAIIFNVYGTARFDALCLGALLLLSFVVLHIPYQLQNNLHFFGGWGNAFKILALSGGAFVVAGSLPRSPGVKHIGSVLEKFIPVGRFLFAVDMIASGIMHFMYMPFVVMLVPTWIPLPTFWGYLAGVALIAGGLGIILNIQLLLAANLLGIIIFIWLITLHIPRAIADPYTDHGNEVISVFEALAFSATAFLIAANAKAGQKKS